MFQHKFPEMGSSDGEYEAITVGFMLEKDGGNEDDGGIFAADYCKPGFDA